MENNDNQIPLEYANFLNKIVDKIKVDLRDNSSVTPFTFLINNENHKFEIFSGYWQSEEDKLAFSINLKQQARVMHADAVCFVSEAWTIENKDKKEIDALLKKYGSVSNCPEKVEVVMISFETNDSIWLGMSNIESTATSKQINDIKWTKSNNIQGKFANILPQKEKKSQEIKDFIARAKEKFSQNGIDPNGSIGNKSISQILDETVEQMSSLGLNNRLINRMIDSINMMQQHFK